MMTRSTNRSRHARIRLAVAAVLSTALVGGAVVAAHGETRGATMADRLKRDHDAAAAVAAGTDPATAAAEAVPGHSHSGAAGTHNHADPATKNLISRAEQTEETVDPTTPEQARSHRASAAAQRQEPAPALKHVPVDPPQPTVPTDRYNLFNACYGLRSVQTGRWLSGTSFTGATAADATGWYFKPTDLGRYLLYSPDERFLGQRAGLAVYAGKAGPATDWTLTQVASGVFRLRLGDSGYLSTGPLGRAVLTGKPGTAADLAPRRIDGCTPFPEITTNVTGEPTAGVTPFQETRGYIDGHTHGMAFEFLGGDVHCGRPWSPWGVTTALLDCPDHRLTLGYGAAMEAFLSGNPSHDPVGWPTFKDWPAPNSLTHEGTYYKWMERSWRAGQRLLVNLLVENNQLCQLYPIKRNSCDDMTSIRLQAHDMHLLERYIDAQHGGPGMGWYRIVTNPVQAREVINSGKMAVVMGIETSVIFGCHRRLGISTCNRDSISKQLDQVQKMGVVQMELVNKFDNALAGVAGDTGSTGYLVNAGNTLETGSPWHMTTCDPNDPQVHDKDQDNSAPIPSQDALFGAVLAVLPPALTAAIPAIPVYPAKHHCNTLGLTDLGAYTIQQMAERHMIFDPDHMSVKARKASLDVIEKLGYPAVISSHSWSTPDAYPRIYADGGFITPYAGDSNGFVKKWQQLLDWANPATYWGIGFGADINGLGAQGDPRPDAAQNPVTYPFTGLGGVVVHKQVSGQRVYDINVDGVSHYGLYPDWIQDLRMQAGDAIVKDMERGPEAYLQMWERGYGIAPDACTHPDQALAPNRFRTGLHRGDDWWTVLNEVGQPHRRLGNTFSYCADRGRSVDVVFDDAGKLLSVRRL